MKKWYQSRTIWVNVLSIILEISNMLMTNPIIPVKYTGVLTLVVNVINIVLRTITTTAIGSGDTTK